MNCFETAPEFVDEDNRRFRERNPVSKEQMFGKHCVLLPEVFVRGKTILDLGCCLGATGHWCLSNGATHYTGIEVQSEYVEGANRLLGKYHPGKFTIHQMAIEKWLSQPDLPSYDVVCILGVLYAFVDYFSILKLSTALAKSTYVVEGMQFGLLETNPNFCGVAFLNEQTINLANQEASFVGRGTRISPKGMAWLMREFDFVSFDGPLFPAPITGTVDIYNRPPTVGQPSRYLLRFERIQLPKKIQSLSDDLQSGTGIVEPWRS